MTAQQPSLLDWTPPIQSYPYQAGWKKTEASRIAAERMDEDSWKIWAQQTAYFIIKAKPSTGKEILAEMQRDYPEKMGNRDILSIRPRITEIRGKGLIDESGIRRNGETVWEAL